jgi:pimeloyl-ACP methyl ester carboxylesterase
MWDWQMPAFSACHRTVRYDLRGFGRSTVPGCEPYSHGDDLQAVLEALGIARAILVGLSLGANVATAFALEHPQAVAGLVLASSGLAGHKWREPRPPEVAEAHAREHGVEAGRRVSMEHALFASAMARPDIAAELRTIVGEYSGWHWANRNPQRPPPPVGDRLQEIDAPALVVTGALDVAGYREIGRVLAEKLPRARHVELPQVGHMLNMEAPETFNRLVLGFAEGVGDV